MNCFNGELYLKDAVNSVINQTFKNWELIFWNNQSTDNSFEVISNYKDNRIKIFNSPSFTNLGAARKNAFQKVSG